MLEKGIKRSEGKKKYENVRIAFLQTCDKNDERNFMDYQIEQFTYG